MEELVVEVVHCLSEELQALLKTNGSCWGKDWVDRRSNLEASTILRELAYKDPHEYRKIMTMSVDQFNDLLSMVEGKITTVNTVMRNAIPARVKLEMALRFLGTGDSYQSLAIFFRVPANTISSFMSDVLKAITTALNDYMKVSKTKDEWKEIQNNFESKWNFPLYVGAIDGKHVAIKRPPGSCSEVYNYKDSSILFSVILLALVDADYKFICDDVGTNGRANDGSVFPVSSLEVAIDNKS